MMGDTRYSPMNQPPEISFQCVRLYVGDLAILISAEEDPVGEQHVVVEAWKNIRDRDGGDATHVRVALNGRREFDALKEALDWAASVAWGQ